MWDVPTLVIMVISGWEYFERSSISPKPLMPISRIRTWVSVGIERIVWQKPTSLLWFNGVAWVLKACLQTLVSISFVVVLPELPVSAITLGETLFKYKFASCKYAIIGSWTCKINSALSKTVPFVVK